MAKYVLFLHERTAGDNSLSPEHIQDMIREYQGWSQAMAERGALIAGHKLTDDAGMVLRGSGESFAVTDGPHAEAKEVIGGLFEIEAKSYDEAVEFAKDCPHLKFGGNIEVRQIDEL